MSAGKPPPLHPAQNRGLRELVATSRQLADHWESLAERLLTDEALRERLVAEASEHVLTFDWADVAEQAGKLYAELAGERSTTA